MQTEETTISLATLEAAEAQFQDALERVLEDLDDPNKGEEKRKIELIITITPDRESQLHTISVHCKTTLGARRVWKGRMIAGREMGRMVGRLLQIEQQQLPFNVTQLRKGAQDD